ncbi:MAG: fatty acid desaturase [Myxococcota bacterium]
MTATRTDSSERRAPWIAWPTLALFVVSIGGWCAIAWSVAQGLVPMAWGAVGATVTAYLLFTPLHDAAHKSLSQVALLNEGVGRVCGWAYLGLFIGFRALHLAHHAHTNEPGADPDYWVSGGNRWTRPLRWVTLDLYYHVAHVRQWRAQSFAHKVEVVVTGVVLLALVGALVAWGLGWEVLWLWLVPLKLVFTFLAYSFDYLPHRPHRVTAKEDRYRATGIHPSPWLTLPLMYQNYHLIHHLYPGVPFYRYPQIWRAEREVLLARGVLPHG